MLRPSEFDLAYSKFKAIVERVTYKKGWHLRVEKGSFYEGVTLIVYIDTVDIRDGVTPITISTSSIVHPEGYEDGFHMMLQMIEHTIRQAEQHEFAEWFKYEGKQVYNPH